MEVQVQELLDRIKSEGVDAARAEATKLLAQAESRAAAMIAEAERATAELEASAKARIEAMEKASRLALVQASRDTILALREKVQNFMQEAVLSSTTEAFDAEFIAKVLPSILPLVAAENSGTLEVLLKPETLGSLDSSLASRLSKELERGVRFKPFTGMDAGFRIAVEGSAVRYDFSAESVAAMLSTRVNARLGECLKAAFPEGRQS
jgi:V/A-type H+-transporting ATPase subunit E